MEEMRTFGYLCPKCGKPVRKSRSIFALEASNAEVECDCGGSALRVSFDGEKYRLTVPCGLCGGTHEAVCRPEQLTEGPGLALACAGSKQFSCFIGPEETVRRHLEELELLAASAVDRVCRRRGATHRLPAATDRDLDDLCCHWKLRIPGTKA